MALKHSKDMDFGILNHCEQKLHWNYNVKVLCLALSCQASLLCSDFRVQKLVFLKVHHKVFNSYIVFFCFQLKNFFPILYLMEERLKDNTLNLHSVRKLATLSAYEVFKDILPDYQIRHQDYSNIKCKYYFLFIQYFELSNDKP